MKSLCRHCMANAIFHLHQMPDHLREGLVNQELPEYGTSAWTDPKLLADSKVTITSTARLHRREGPPFTPGAGNYRVLPDDRIPTKRMMNHA